MGVAYGKMQLELKTSRHNHHYYKPCEPGMGTAEYNNTTEKNQLMKAIVCIA